MGTDWSAELRRGNGFLLVLLFLIALVQGVTLGFLLTMLAWLR